MTENWEQSEHSGEFWEAYDKKRNKAIGYVLEKYRDIDSKAVTSHGLELAISLFGVASVDRYLEEHGFWE
jgi:hypothetical protein